MTGVKGAGRKVGSEVGAVAGASAQDPGKPHEAIGFIIRDMECHGGK